MDFHLDRQVEPIHRDPAFAFHARRKRFVRRDCAPEWSRPPRPKPPRRAFEFQVRRAVAHFHRYVSPRTTSLGGFQLIERGSAAAGADRQTRPLARRLLPADAANAAGDGKFVARFGRHHLAGRDRPARPQIADGDHARRRDRHLDPRPDRRSGGCRRSAPTRSRAPPSRAGAQAVRAEIRSRLRAPAAGCNRGSRSRLGQRPSAWLRAMRGIERRHRPLHADLAVGRRRPNGSARPAGAIRRRGRRASLPARAPMPDGVSARQRRHRRKGRQPDRRPECDPTPALTARQPAIANAASEHHRLSLLTCWYMWSAAVTTLELAS